MSRLDDAKRLCRKLTELLDAIEYGRTPAPLFDEFWIAVNTTGQLDTARECIRLLGRFARRVVVTTKPESMGAILPPLRDYVFATLPYALFVGGFYALDCWGELAFESEAGWRSLRERADECARLTCTSMVRVDCESIVKPILKGKAVDIRALEAGITASGIRGAQIRWSFYDLELQPGNSVAASITSLFARMFPTARAMDSNYGRPAWVTDSAHQLCATGMRKLWPNRLDYRILVDHAQDPTKHHYQPGAVAEAIAGCPGPVSVWINTASGWTYESKVETAQATAAALEASR